MYVTEFKNKRLGVNCLLEIKKSDFKTKSLNDAQLNNFCIDADKERLQYLDSNLFQGIQCDRCNENLYWWIQLDKYLHLNTGCCYKDSVKKRKLYLPSLND